jgi:hypothetical protein
MQDGDNLKDVICRELFDHVEKQVALGDTKAGLLLAANSILLTLESAVVGAVWAKLHLPTALVVAAPVAFILLSLGFGLVAIIPNRRHGSLPEKLVFSSIASAPDSQAFVARLDAMTAADMMADVKSQIYGKSVYAHRKFRLLRVSVLLTLVGLLAWAASLVVVGLSV